MNRWMVALALSCTALAAGVVSADAIIEPQCEHGWTAQHAGHGSYCGPHVCTTDGQCGGGHCVDVARCFRSQPMDTGMAVLPPGAAPPTYEAPIDALCGANDSCAVGSHCMHERECTEPPHGMCSVIRTRGHRPPVACVVVAALAIGRFGIARRRGRDRSRAGRPDLSSACRGARRVG
jgi:hypothetical protein